MVATSGMPLRGIHVMEKVRFGMRTEYVYKNQKLVLPLL